MHRRVTVADVRAATVAVVAASKARPDRLRLTPGQVRNIVGVK